MTPPLPLQFAQLRRHSRPSFLRQLLAVASAAISAQTFFGAPLEFEAIKCIIDGYGKGRVIGIARNATAHLVVLPTLEVTYVTREQPTKPQLARLTLAYYALPGQSQSFHSGGFSGPPYYDRERSTISSEQILEMKSWRILPAELEAPSENWNQWTKARESLEPQNVKFSFSPGEGAALGGIWVQGRLPAPAGAHFEYIQLVASCFDATNQLVEVFSFQVRPKDGTCLRIFPHFFEGGEYNSLKPAPASVKLQAAYFKPCTQSH